MLGWSRRLATSITRLPQGGWLEVSSWGRNADEWRWRITLESEGYGRNEAPAGVGHVAYGTGLGSREEAQIAAEMVARDKGYL